MSYIIIPLNVLQNIFQINLSFQYLLHVLKTYIETCLKYLLYCLLTKWRIFFLFFFCSLVLVCSTFPSELRQEQSIALISGYGLLKYRLNIYLMQIRGYSILLQSIPVLACSYMTISKEEKENMHYFSTFLVITRMPSW